MAKIFVHLPLNISRAIEEMLKEYGKIIEQKYQISIEIINMHQCQQQSNTAECAFENQDIPDIFIGNVNYFSNFSDEALKENFRSLPGAYPIRKELSKIGFPDPNGYLNTFAIVPFSIFYNPDMVKEHELPKVWEDLLDPKWHKKIIMPDKFHMAPKMINAFMKGYYPKKMWNYYMNIVCQGSPIDVVNSVDSGMHPIGITNISFSLISKCKNISLLWPQDGILSMPLVMAFNKNADERLMEVGEFMLSLKVQEYLALQKFIPASSEVGIPNVLLENNFNLRWSGWQNFMEIVKTLE